MVKTSENFIQNAISSWVLDMEEQKDRVRNPLLQIDVIPLACVWSLARQRLNTDKRTCFQFTQDFLAHNQAPKVWESRAVQAGDMSFIEPTRSYQRYLTELKRPGIFSPYRFELEAAQDGRSGDQETIRGIEISLISALGHAAYNSTSGTQMLILDPLGPSERESRAFMRLAGQNVQQFIQEEKL